MTVTSAARGLIMVTTAEARDVTEGGLVKPFRISKRLR